MLSTADLLLRRRRRCRYHERAVIWERQCGINELVLYQ